MAWRSCARAGHLVCRCNRAPLGALKGQQPPAFAVAFAWLAAAATAIFVLRLRAGIRLASAASGSAVLTLAAFLGLTYSGAVMNIFVATRHPIDAEIAAVTARVPDGVELVSIGPVDDVFLYYYGRPIRQLPDAEGIGRGERPWRWFCMGNGPNMPQFDLPYEPLGTISVEPAYSDHPHDVVIIGRRLRTPRPGSRPAVSVESRTDFSPFQLQASRTSGHFSAYPKFGRWPVEAASRRLHNAAGRRIYGFPDRL